MVLADVRQVRIWSCSSCRLAKGVQVEPVFDSEVEQEGTVKLLAIVVGGVRSGSFVLFALVW